jgi:hypothetical protein
MVSDVISKDVVEVLSLLSDTKAACTGYCKNCYGSEFSNRQWSKAAYAEGPCPAVVDASLLTSVGLGISPGYQGTIKLADSHVIPFVKRPLNFNPKHNMQLISEMQNYLSAEESARLFFEEKIQELPELKLEEDKDEVDTTPQKLANPVTVSTRLKKTKEFLII